MKLILAATLIFVVAACGGSKNSHDLDYTPPDYVPPGSFEESVRDARVTCEGECPANVGLIVIRKRKSFFTYAESQCSGTLIGSRIVVTNSHCIPDEVKASPDVCEDNLAFVLPRAQVGKTTRSRCTRLIFASRLNEEDKKAPDYAFFEIKEEMTQAPTPFNNEGFVNGRKFYALVVDPDSKSEISGVIRRKNCVAIQYSTRAPSFKHEFGEMVSLFDGNCKVISGNSGSSVYAEGETSLRAVMAQGPKDEADDPTSKFTRYFGVAVNMACLSHPEVGLAANSKCSSVVQDRKKGYFGLSMREAVYNQILELISKQPKLYRYQVAFGEKKAYVIQPIILPTCVRPESSWSAEEKAEYYSEVSSPTSTKRTLKHTAPHVSILLGSEADTYLRIVPKPSFLPLANLRFELDFDKVKAGVTNATVTVGAQDLTHSIRMCGAAENNKDSIDEKALRKEIEQQVSEEP